MKLPFQGVLNNINTSFVMTIVYHKYTLKSMYKIYGCGSFAVQSEFEYQLLPVNHLFAD